MASILSRQLANLVRPTGSVAGRPSLLFPVHEAKKIDLETIFNIAKEGLEELQKHDERFSSFRETLFSDESAKINRESRTKDYNKHLDETISQFLRLLAPFFLLNPAHKTLEYLIRHYMVYTYNVDDVLACILPYHETQLFVRMVQMINLWRPQNKKWQFLQPIQREGTPLLRSAVVALALKNHYFLSFVCGIAHNALTANALSKTITSFYTAVLLEMLSTAKRIDTTLINSFLEYLLSGLRATNVEFQSASYMIVSQLSSCSTLIPALTTKIIRTILKHAVATSLPQALLCIVCVCQTQPSPILPSKAIELLAKQKGLTTVLGHFFEKNYDLNPFLKLILDQLLDSSFSDPMYLSLTVELLRELPLGPQMTPIVTRLFDNYVQYRKEAKQNLEYEKVLAKLLRCIDNRFPIELDEAIGHCLDRDKNESADWAYDFITRSLPDAQLHTSLFLSLHHPDTQRRLAALNKLAKTEVEFSDPQVRQHVGHTLSVRLIVGEDPQVTLKVLGLKFLLDAVPEDVMFERLTKLTEDSPHHGIQISAFQILAGDFLNKFPNFVNKVLFFVLNQLGSLFLSSKSVVGLSFLQKLSKISHQLFSDMPSIDLSDSPTDNDLSTALSTIVSVFAKNLMQNSSLLPLSVSIAQHETEGPCKILILLALNTALLQLNNYAEQFSLIKVLLDLSNSVIATSQQASSLLASISTKNLVSTILKIDGDLSSKLSHAQYLSLWNVVVALSGYPENKSKKQNSFKVPSAASLSDSFGDQSPEELEQWQQYVYVLRRVVLALTPTKESIFPTVFQPFLLHFYTSFLQTPSRFLEFFSYFWVTPEVERIVQTRALRIVTLFITSLDEVITNWEAVVFSLLVALTLHSSARTAALGCIEGLRAQTVRVAKEPQHTSNSLRKILLRFIEQVLESKLEFTSDSTYFGVFVKEVLAREEAVFRENVRTEAKSIASYQSPLENFMLSFKEFHASHFARYVMLKATQTVNSHQKVILTHPLLDELIKKSDDGTIGMYESGTLEVLLRQFTLDNKFLFTDDNNKYFATFISILATQYVPSPLRKHDPRRILLACVTAELFSTCAPSNKQALFQHLTSLTSLSFTKSPDAEAHALQAAAREVLANAVHDSAMLSGYLQGFAHDAHEKRGVREWAVMVTAVLEVVRARATELADANLVIPPLFALLTHLHCPKIEEDSDTSGSESESDEQTYRAEGDEYPVQLALACIASILRHLSERRKLGETVHFPKETTCDVALIEKIIKESKAVTTASFGVQALAAIAAVYPLLIVPRLVQLCALLVGTTHMDIEDVDSENEGSDSDEEEEDTKMDGDESEDEDEESEAIKRKEEYRYNLLLLFVSEVLPPLAGHESDQETVDSILAIFLRAWERIPPTKLLSFFSLLVRSIDTKYLSNFILMLLNKHTNETLRIASRLSNGNEITTTTQNYTSTFEFCKSLCEEVGRSDTVRALVHLCNLLKLFISGKETKLLSNITVKPASQHSRTIQLFILNFIISQLDAKHVLLKTRKPSDEEQYIVLFESFLVLLKSANASISKDPHDKHYQRVQSQILESLDCINRLLSIPAFITSIDKLLTHADPQIRRRALVILNNKLGECRATINRQEANLFVGLTSSLSKIVTSNETDGNKQSALLSMEILCRNFGEEFAYKFVELLPVVVTAMSSVNHHVVSSSLLCVASLCSELHTQILPYIQQFFPQILGVLEGTLQGKGDISSNALLQQSCLSSLRVIFSSVSQFLSPYLGQILHLTTHSKLVGNGTSAVAQASASLLQSVATKIQPRLLLGPLYATIERSLRLDSLKSIELQLDVLSRVTSSMDANSVTRYHKAIFKVLLSVFAHPSPGVESKVIAAFMALVLRLNEVLFKPLFLKVLDWAVGSEVKKYKSLDHEHSLGANGVSTESVSRSPERVAFFYRLVDSLIEQLKQIFVPYFAYIWDDMAHNLTEIKETTLSNKKRKVEESNYALRQKTLQYTLHSLLLLMKHDKEDFVTVTRFDKIYVPLVGQLSNLMGEVSEYRERTYNSVIPCIVLLGSNAKEVLWKNLNYQICLATRHSAAVVKSAAVTCLSDFFSKLGDKILPLVPETVQFISELLEDANPEVETKTQLFVKRVDELVGQGGISTYL
eukprot:Phypoly_transcript_00142.p1 GENE.Phypoly_transcript_00142~~Phypoly_transcript_00142.p1  ORF type:complete len:2127 (+),score=276.73 Phypoly_transcript_00142:96-6476(+)